MTRNELESFIVKTYNTSPEYLWERYPSFAVFRHRSNRKWFAVIMTIPKEKLGITEDGDIDVVNIKCSDEIIASFWEEDGIHPAYHMSKRHWLSVALDGTASDDTVTWLLEISFRLTDKKRR